MDIRLHINYIVSVTSYMIVYNVAMIITPSRFNGRSFEHFLV